MRWFTGMLTVIFCVQLAFAIPAKAEAELKALVSAYNAHDYRKAAQYGELLVQKQPRNAEARYYLANTYVQLKQMEQAGVQYQRCLELAPNTELAQNSSAALKSISRYLNPPKHKNQNHKKKHGRNYATSGSPEEQQIWNDAQDRIRTKEDDANRQINKILQQSQDDIASIPSRSYRMRSNGRMHSGKNPNLAPGKADINSQANEKISKIKEALAKDKRDILDDADKRIAGLRR